MRRLVFILTVVAVMLAGCNNRTNTNTDTKTNVVVVDSIALKKAELIKNEGIKAIGNINFFISKEEFDKQENLFKEQLKTTDIYKNGYFLGDYNFWNITGSFFNDSLFNVHMIGARIQYDDYNYRMPKQYESLLSILTEKYGLPDEKKELPAWSDMSNNSTWILAEWNLGFKKLFVIINCLGVDYRLDFFYYVPEVANRKKQAEKEQTEQNNHKAVEAL